MNKKTIITIVVIAVVALGATAVFALGNHGNSPQTQPPSTSDGQMQISPTSGPVGTMVTIRGSAPFNSTSTIYMGTYVAANNVAPSPAGTLTFAVPASFGPQSMVPPPGAYNIVVVDKGNIESVGAFTLTSH